MILNSNFIVIEELQHAPYKIDNLSSQVGVSYAQKGGNALESCPTGEDRPFAWRNVLEKNFMLNVRFFVQKSATDFEWISEIVEYSIDILNRTV